MNSESPPLVSIIIPTYNRAHLIGETIQSVIDQTYCNWELIIVDDGSTDQTSDVIKKCQDPRLHYLQVAHSGAFGIVRNHGLLKAKGEFITFLDSDDLWHPDKLQQQVDTLLSSAATFVFTNIELFGETSVIVPDFKTIDNEKLLPLYLQEGHFAFYPSSLMFRNSALEKIGLMDESSATGADTDLFLNLSHHFTGSFLSARLVKIRKHSQNTSSSDFLFSYTETIELVRNLYKKGYISGSLFRATVSKLHYKMGLLLIENNQYPSSFTCFLNHFLHKPLRWKGWIRLLQSILLSLFNSPSRTK